MDVSSKTQKEADFHLWGSIETHRNIQQNSGLRTQLEGLLDASRFVSHY